MNRESNEKVRIRVRLTEEEVTPQLAHEIGVKLAKEMKNSRDTWER